MNDELNYALSKLENALSKLQEGADSAEDELQKDGVIQRFEFTFELLWKTLKIFLRNKGIDTKTPKDSLKEAFKIGWITEEKVFLDMLEDRNKTSHIYDRDTAEEIFGRIRNRYVLAVEVVFRHLRRQK